METASLANSWVDSYLDALLSSGLSTEYTKKSTYDEPEAPTGGLALAEKNIAAKYYVNQILNLDEEACQMAWQKVSRSASNSRLVGEKDARLQYLSWRVWGMKRKHHAVKDANAATLRELSTIEEKSEDGTGRESLASAGVGGANDAEELSKIFPTSRLKSLIIPETDSSEGDPNLLSPDMPASPTALPAVPSGSLAEADSALTEHRVPKLYCVLISMHGLVRGTRMELGKDADTGGQVKYVVELAAALAKHPAVHRVDLLTRLIRDPKVDKDYGQPEEALIEKVGELGGAYIVRVPCGPQEVYLTKERLWPYVREFADNAIAHVQGTMSKLMQAGEPCELYDVHGHYADAGEAAALVSFTLGCDMVLTGHSLGRNKLDHLLKSGTVNRAEIEATYAISRRIEGEERALDAAMMVFTSTQQEVKDQWGLYDGYDPVLERVVRQRYRRGRHFPLMTVIPPGLDFSNLKVSQPVDPWEAALKAAKSPRVSSASNLAGGDDTAATDAGPGTPKGANGSRAGTPRAYTEDPPIWRDIFKFLRNPRKPVILAMSRPDAKKNITTLVQAFGENASLRSIANLVLIMGNRDNIDSMAAGSAKTLNQVLKLIDVHDLYGSVAYPKHHSQKDISDIYLLSAATRGVFTNVALQEPFGLTVIEAAAHGVPTVATKNGGPVDIMATLHHGLLVDPTNSKAIAAALLKILTNPQVWDEMSASGVKNIMAYSWPSHCMKYLEAIELEKRFIASHRKQQRTLSGSWDARTFAHLRGDAPADDAAVPSNGGGHSPLAPSSLTRGSASFHAHSSSQDKIERFMSTPNANHLNGAIHSAISGIPRTTSSMSGASADDVAILECTGHEEGLAEGPRGFSRSQLAVVALDGDHAVAAVAATLKDLARAAEGAKGLGLGVTSVMGFDDTSKALREAGVELGVLDFIICNAGGDIWHARVNSAGAVEWAADEQYEHHIDYRWDRQSVFRTLNKIVSGPDTLKSSASILKSVRSRGDSALLKALSNLPEEERGIHPHHVCLALDPAARQAVGGSYAGQSRVLSKAASLNPLTVVDKLQRRLRVNGYRVQLTLQMVPEDSEWLAAVHITPLRASRALSLRWLATKLNLSMEAVSVVLQPPSLDTQQEGLTLGAFTSDAEDLLAGLQHVYILPPTADPKLPSEGLVRRLIPGVPGQAQSSMAEDTAAIEQMKVSVDPEVTGQRVQVAKEGVAALVSAIEATAPPPVAPKHSPSRSRLESAGNSL